MKKQKYFIIIFILILISLIVFFLNKKVQNIEDLSVYSDKEAFLVSDKDWRQILTLIPFAVWTNEDGTITKYPFLIYHEESESFDIDSIYYFFEQYNPKEISYFEDLPSKLDELLSDSFEIQKKANKLDNLEGYENVVYVEDGYELALLASTYASLIHSPLIIKGYNDDIDFSQKNVICIGNPTLECNEQYSLEQLQEKYLEKTQTDKMILVNPDDLSISANIDENYQNYRTEKGRDIMELYSKTSLVSPILASVKHELILSTTSQDYESVDLFIEGKITSLGIDSNYLTIICSPDAIQMSKNEEEKWSEVDNSIYGHLGNEKFQSLSVGRIFGISISDVSSYISRDLFYKDLPISNKFAMLIPEGYNPEERISGKIELKPNEELLELLGLQSESIYIDETNYTSFPIKQALEDKKIINYVGHGFNHGWMNGLNTDSIINKNMWLSSSFIIGDACATCSYEFTKGASAGGDNRVEFLFCTNILRRGSLGYVGAISPSGSTNSFSGYFIENLLNGNSIGESLKNIKHFESTIIGGCEKGQGLYAPFCEPYYILLGDPTINLGFEYPNIDKVEIQNEKNATNLVSTIIVPQLNQLEDWSDSIYEIPHGINSIKDYIEIDPNDASGNSLRSDGIFSFDVNFPKEHSLNPIKAEFIDSELNIIELSFEQEEDGVISFINFDIPEKIFVLKIEPIYDDKNKEYKFYVSTYFSGEFNINEFSPRYKFKIYWELED